MAPERSLQVVVVTEKFAPHPGGTAVVWTEWCRRWPAGAVRVVTPMVEGATDFDQAQCFPVHRVSYLDLPKVRMPLMWLGLFGALLQECWRRRPDLVHCGQILETGIYGPWLSLALKLPYAIHTYGEEIAHYGQSPIWRQVMRTVLGRAAAVTTISRYTEAQLRDVVGYRGPVLIVAPGVDTERFQPGDRVEARRRLGLGDGPVLLTIARLMERKGHDRVLQVLPRLLQQYPGLQYLVAGTGPDQKRLRRLIDQAGLQASVQLLGRVESTTQQDLLHACDVFVHPNRQLPDGDVEGFGIVFLEAAACGIPVVGGRSGGTMDAVEDGVNGFLVDGDRPEELQERLLALLGDPELRRGMGTAGTVWARRFSWTTAAQQVWDWCVPVKRLV